MQSTNENENEIKSEIKYNFIEAKKVGNKPSLLPAFLVSPAFNNIIEFITTIQSKLVGMKISDVPPTTNIILKNFDGLFERLEKIFEKNPPLRTKENPEETAFKNFHADLLKEYDDIMNSTILKENCPPGISIELKSYFCDSFGNQFRLDYGTGHELNFLCFLLILYKTGLINQNDLPFLALNVFRTYILFVRKLQTNYVLEPAGTRGVWGLDEYQFIPFIFGASQLSGNREISPKSAMDMDTVIENSKEYLYMDCVKYVREVKKGASFTEYAPILASICNVPKWEKVASGLVKMYIDDVLKKIVVIQHFYFGSILTLE